MQDFVFCFVSLRSGSQDYFSSLWSGLSSCDAMPIALMGAFGWLPESVVTPLLGVLPTLPHTLFFTSVEKRIGELL